MKVVELYGRVRYAVQIEGLSRREAARQFGIDPRTVAKMLAFSVPPGYRRRRPPARPKLDPFTGIIDGILVEDEGRPRKQRHTSKRIFERLRDEHGYAGGITIVKDYVLSRRLRQLEVFVPLRHDPGHAQADFGEALAEIAGVERKIHFFAVDLPHSDACFVQSYPAETTEAFCDGQSAVAVGGDSDYCRHRHDAAALTLLQVSGVEPQIRPLAGERPVEKRMHALVDVFAQLGNLRLADPGQPHRLHQIVNPPG